MLQNTRSSQSLRHVLCARRLTAMTALSVLTCLITGCGDSAETQPAPATAPDNDSAASDDTSDTASREPSENSSAAATTESSETATADSSGRTDIPETIAKDNAKPSQPAATTGSFSGRVILKGTPPDLPVLARADDENLKDKEVCGMADVPDDSLLVGADSGIANVFLYLRRAPKGFKQETPTEPVVLDQKGCVFTPHAALIQTGQPVMVKSSDAVQHNVHTFPARNQGVNILIKPNDQAGVPLEYARAESEPIQVKCDIHAWMASYHLVLDHPFMAVTDEAGSFRIEGLPVGDYEFRVWHERAGLLERELAVSVTGSDAPVELTYAVDQFTK